MKPERVMSSLASFAAERALCSLSGELRAGSRDRSNFRQAVADRVRECMGAATATLWRMDDMCGDQSLRAIAISHADLIPSALPASIALDDVPDLMSALAANCLFHAADVDGDPAAASRQAQWLTATPASALMVASGLLNGELLGLVTVASYGKPRQWHTVEQMRLRSLAVQLVACLVRIEVDKPQQATRTFCVALNAYGMGA